MATKATQPNKTRHWKPLTPAQMNAVECLLAGKNDTETGADPRVQVTRQTIWEWRTENPLFIAELQQRRAALWSASAERLRGLMAKAIENISGAIESGDVAASWSLLKCTGLFGNGVMNAVQGAHLAHELERLAANQARREEEALMADGSMTGALERLNFNVAARTEEILAELLEAYTEPGDMDEL